MFAVLTAIFTKIGVESVNSDFATLIRTLAILLALAGIVVGTGRWQLFGSIAGRTYCFLVSLVSRPGHPGYATTGRLSSVMRPWWL
jgi:uncharacterized membrane protein